MATQTSTGFEARLHAGESFASIFNGGAILIFSGPQPENADAAATGVLLAIVSDRGLVWAPGDDASGLRFASAGRYVVNDPEQSWVIRGVAVGVPGWCRLVGPVSDPGAASIEFPRIDGAVGPTDSQGDVQLRLLPRLMDMKTDVAADILNWYFARPPTGD